MSIGILKARFTESPLFQSVMADKYSQLSTSVDKTSLFVSLFGCVCPQCSTKIMIIYKDERCALQLSTFLVKFDRGEFIREDMLASPLYLRVYY